MALAFLLREVGSTATLGCLDSVSQGDRTQRGRLGQPGRKSFPLKFRSAQNLCLCRWDPVKMMSCCIHAGPKLGDWGLSNEREVWTDTHTEEPT